MQQKRTKKCGGGYCLDSFIVFMIMYFSTLLQEQVMDQRFSG